MFVNLANAGRFTRRLFNSNNIAVSAVGRIRSPLSDVLVSIHFA